MLSSIYYFKNKGIMLSSHDKLNTNPEIKNSCIKVIDLPNNAFETNESILKETESII